MRPYATTAIALVLALAATSATAKTTIEILRAETTDVEKAINTQAEKDFEALHPDVDVKFEYIANEAYKQKLPTLLQSKARPDIYYSWGGGVLRDQAKAGFVEDITDQVADEWAKTYSPAGIKAFSVNGKIVGAPMNASEVVFWTNLKLAKKAGIDVSKIKTWDEFLAALKKAKAAGVTPIMVGGKDKWPLHFYYGYLALREAGEAGFKAAMAGEGKGFASAPFVKAGEDFKRLIDLQPFEPGFMSTTYEQASGRFGDGEALFHLMADFDYQSSKDRSQSKKGLPDDQLAVLRFPMVAGGKGAPSDTFGGVNGWVVAKGAPKEAVDFLAFWNGPKYQAMAAAEGAYIPTAIAASSAIKNPFFKKIADDLAASKFHQIFLDQDLGADVGATFNDASADLAQGVITPEQAAQEIQDAWSFQ
ncbi:ABC transporter substrate-binding protein [Thioclava dalianensis]|uniref:ABC transporter substrate-binding protein n=1 Tax=Thioclava dalianensis TaxID=1185766 RepID=A0A074T9J2_9RHOB|nr:extracellular solute-binding protein [Thioclava dalianensis]KEP68354.1 ABC transporter substrate-binding protein [Thioclava dalianensis]SFM73937.1 raffinose/stachyose/melibiose transport system substrate-binding protein [Thioclava dalianensis]